MSTDSLHLFFLWAGSFLSPPKHAKNSLLSWPHFSFLLLSLLFSFPYSKIPQKSCVHSLFPLPLLPVSLDPTPVSLPCPSSKAAPVRVIDDVHPVKVIVQVSVLIQLDPSVALDIVNDFLETLCSLGFQDITPSWVSSYRKETYWPLLCSSFGSSTNWPLNVGGSSVSILGPLASVSLHSLGTSWLP